MKLIRILMTTLFSMILVLSTLNFTYAKSLNNLVPKDSLIYFQIGHIDQFLSQVDQFIKPLGVDMFLGGKSLKNYLAETIATSLGDTDLNWLDWNGTIGISVITPFDSKGVILYVPLKNPKNEFEKVKSKLSKAINDERTSFKGTNSHIVVLSSPELSKAFPPQSSLDISELDTYKPGSLAMKINMKSLLTDMGMDEKTLVSNMEEMYGDLENTIPGMNENSAKMLGGLFEGMFKAIKDIENLDGMLLPSVDGASSSFRLSFAPTGEAANILKSIPPQSGTKDFLDYLPAKYLYSTVLNISPENMKAIHDLVNQFVFTILKTKDTDLRVINQINQRYFDAIGNRTAMAFDLDFDSSLITELEDLEKEKVAPVLKKFLNTLYFKMVYVQEVRNSKAIRDYFQEMTSNPIIKNWINSITEPYGIRILFNLATNQTQQGFSFDRFSYKLETVDANLPASMDNESKTLLKEVFNTLSDHMTVYMHTTNNRSYMVMGPDGVQLLQNLVQKNRFPNQSLKQVLGNQRYGQEIPDTCHLFSQFSFNRLFQIIAPILKAKGMEIATSEKSPLGIISYLQVDKNTLNTSVFMSMDDILPMYQTITTILFQKMGSSMNNDPAMPRMEEYSSESPEYNSNAIEED